MTSRIGYADPTVRVDGVRMDGTQAEHVTDVVAEETPVTIAYNLASHAVMMATPGDLEDFAVGFTLTEGIVSNASEIVGVSVVRHAGGVE
nr:formate dehydrogenase accessory sulfurtransferase FdhD [Gemmatimonadaceae bacterium]